MRRYTLSLPPLLLLLLFAACAGPAPESMEDAPLVLRPAAFGDLPGWQADRHDEALAAFSRSCARILRQPAEKSFGPAPAGGTFGDWHPACREVAAGNITDARAFFERHFTPWRATAGGAETEGLFTGYYEAALNGSRTRHGPYQHALRLRPADLVMVDLGLFREELKGQRIAGRVIEGQLKPYEDRAAIVSGALPQDEKLSFVWVDDAADAFFLQVQGSGRVLLDDGTQMRVGYAGQNGHPYYAIGRELIKRGELTKDDVSMQSIRSWLERNPGQAAELMNTNKSYVFFKQLDGEGPLGGENVALTPGRSLAIDRTRIPYGVPLWLDAAAPADGLPAIRRLMIAQDTGGAIRGPVRGDYFWGFGPEAEATAGVMKAKGGYWLLLPKTVRPSS